MYKNCKLVKEIKMNKFKMKYKLMNYLMITNTINNEYIKFLYIIFKMNKIINDEHVD